jgi:tetratricopeptide (TPR) repeat protein
MAQNDQVEQLKVQGNEAFGKKDYNTAIKYYTEALVLDPKNVSIFSNRCSAYFSLEKFREALNDAKQSININPEFSKGHYKLGMAYAALNQPREAAKAFNKALSLDPNSADTLSQYEKNQRAYIDRYFSTKAKGQPVEVKWISMHKGKGVFASRNFKEGELITHEDPISSHRVLNKNAAVKCCGFCMRSYLSPENLGSNGSKYWKEMYNGPKPEWTYCEHCKGDDIGEFYCSKTCKQKAWSSYHQLLCPGYDYKTKQNVKTAGHESLKALFKLCSDQNKSHPLFIVRMLAIVLSQMIFNQKSFDDAWEPFFLFVSSNEPCFGEELGVETLMNIVKDEKYTIAANVNNYRHLHWAIVKNAQSLNPVSDFHLYLNSLPESVQFQVVKGLGYETTPFYFLQSSFMSGLSAWGNGLFAIANSMNHSCEPNVATASASNSHKITFLAIRPIKKGEELSISYIDETKPFPERQRILSESYAFTCQCEKCSKQS